MTNRPSRSTAAGTAYLDLRKLARDTKRPTDELLQLYALEGFLDRLTASQHAQHLIFKSGVLLAAFDTRRPTRDIDFAATDIDGDLAIRLDPQTAPSIRLRPGQPRPHPRLHQQIQRRLGYRPMGPGGLQPLPGRSADRSGALLVGAKHRRSQNPLEVRHQPR